MIRRFYLQSFLSFDKVDLEFDTGLIVFTGASGAGKSILMSSILSLFGDSDAKAILSEVSIDNVRIRNEEYMIEKNEEFIIKQTNVSKTRYLLNNQTISKKSLKIFTANFSKHLHLKDTTDFHSVKIVSFLDFLASRDDGEFELLLNEFKTNFLKLKELKLKLKQKESCEKDLDELIQDTKYQINKIAQIDPKIDEYDQLKLVKENLSKKDKIQSAIDKSYALLQNTHHINTALQLLEKNSDFFDECINEINNIFEKFNDNLSAYADDNIESILDRIELLSQLQKKYGTLENAIKYKEEQEKKLQELENISFDKSILIKNIDKLTIIVDTLSSKLTIQRKQHIKKLENSINEYLKYLYLDGLKITINAKNLDRTGQDEIVFTLNNTSLDKISSGEFNRLRLALLASRSKYECQNGGILFLDEIDANLSGKESESIAKVLSELSKFYQIFAISHQPQLSATAKQHFLVKKENNISTVKLLDKTQRVDEISRMISGKDISNEAIGFAKRLLE